VRTNQVIALISVVTIAALAAGTTIGYSISPGKTRTVSSTVMLATTATTILTSTLYFSLSDQSSLNTSTLSTAIESYNSTYFPWSYPMSVSVNYSGSWHLTYRGYDGGIYSPPNNVSGTKNGTGFYQTTVTLYGIGYVERTLCATATKLDSSSLTLLLSVSGQTNTTNYQTATECATVAP
jgi:hypothetical protein